MSPGPGLVKCAGGAFDIHVGPRPEAFDLHICVRIEAFDFHICVRIKTTHTQQPDGTWVTIVVPCAPRETIITLPPLSATLLHFVMESDLQELVLGFLALRDLVAVRIASMVVHEAMMDTALDLWDMSEFLTSVEQARALTSARLTKLHRFKLVPARCLCSAADALAHLDLGATISGAMPSQELLLQVLQHTKGRHVT